MKKKLTDFKTGITKMEMIKLVGGMPIPIGIGGGGSGGGGGGTCGQTTPNTVEPSVFQGRWDSNPDSYCDDD